MKTAKKHFFWRKNKHFFEQILFAKCPLGTPFLHSLKFPAELLISRSATENITKLDDFGKKINAKLCKNRVPRIWGGG